MLLERLAFSVIFQAKAAIDGLLPLNNAATDGKTPLLQAQC